MEKSVSKYARCTQKDSRDYLSERRISEMVNGISKHEFLLEKLTLPLQKMK